MADLFGFFKLSRDLSVVISRNLSQVDGTITPLALENLIHSDFHNGTQGQWNAEPLEQACSLLPCLCIAQGMQFSSVGLGGLCGKGKYFSSYGKMGEVIFCRDLGMRLFWEGQPWC